MTYSNNPPSSIEAGNHLIYAAQPSGVILSANPQTKIAGSVDPLLTYSGTGFVNDDGLADNPLTYTAGSLIRISGELVTGSPYTILQGSLNLIGGYNPNFSYSAANLVITPPPVVTPVVTPVATSVATPVVTTVISKSFIDTSPFLPQIAPLQSSTVFVFQNQKELGKNIDLIDTENDGIKLPTKLHKIISLALSCSVGIGAN